MKHISLLLSFSLAAAGLFSCAQDREITKPAWGFTTTWDIRLYEGEEEDARKIASIIASTSELLSSYDAHSKGGVYQLNKERSLTSAPLAKALSVALNMQEKTNGYFNPFLLHLSEANKAALQDGAPLDEQTAASLATQARETSLHIDGENITLIGEGDIDLGAIGKGYCLDLIQDYLDEHSIKGYLISGGTSSLLLGETLSKSQDYFEVSPRDLSGYTLKASRCAISTSSVSEQRYDIKGSTYSHIVNPFDGLSLAKRDFVLLQADLPSSIDYPNAFLDAASTSLFHQNNEDVHAFCSQYDLSYMIGLDQKIIASNMVEV